MPTPRAETDEDVPVDIRVFEGAVNIEGHTLTVTDAKADGHRAEIIDSGTIRVTPAQDYHGVITVTYQIHDNGSASAASAIVTVRPVNDAPVVHAGARSIRGTTEINLEASDADGDALDWTIVSGPAHGTITGDPPRFQYTPNAGFVGDDAITYRVSDHVTSDSAVLLLHVGIGTAPVATAEAVATNEDQALDLLLHGVDADADVLAFAIVSGPAHGVIVGVPPNITYFPVAEFSGDDAIEFSVTDPFQLSSTATLTIHVNPVDDAPVATPQTVDATEDTSVAIALHGTDIEGDVLSFQVVTGPGHGTLSAESDGLVYTPAANYHGPDEFSFAASDGAKSSAPAKVSITVASVNDVPVATSLSAKPTEDTPMTITLSGSDADGEPLTYAIVTPPQHGTLNNSPPQLTYVPNADYNGPDSFSYTVSDATSTSAAATVTLDVAAVNDPPVPVNGSVTTAEDTAAAITLEASDVDSATLTFTVLTLPSDGSLTGSGASWTYKPAANASGTRSFTFRVSDGKATADATFTIQITPVNDPPTGKDDFLATDPGVTLTFDVAANDSDLDGDPVELDSVDPPAHGTADVVDGKLVYTPAADFLGVELVTYTIVDPDGAQGTAKAHIGVGTFPPDAPAETLLATGDAASSNLNAPSVSGDGRFIAFTAFAALVPGDTNGQTDIYLYDRGNRTVTRISEPTGGGQANGSSFRPRISGNGRYVVFESGATNLVASDTNNKADVFRHDRVTGETVRVSVATGGGQASGTSSAPQISDDGNLVAFASLAFDLVANDANGASDVFVRDLAAGTTERVSLGITGGDADLASLEPALSGDGRFVAFSSAATNLVPGDTNNLSDVFVRDRVAGTTSRVSVSSTGIEANAACTAPTISQDGRFTAFLSNATNLVAGAPVPIQLYVRDVQAQTTTRPLPSTSSTVTWGRLSGDGRYLAQLNGSGVSIRDRFAALTAVPLGAGSWTWPALSGSGRFVVALTSNANLIVAPNPL